MILDKSVELDWLSFTLPYSDISMERARSMGKGYEKTELSYGRFKYTRSTRMLDGANIYFNPERKEMGIHVSLNSASLAVVGLRPLQMLNLIIDWGGSFKRLDLAFDDFSNLLDVDEMYRKILAGEVATRYRRVARISNAQTGSYEKMGDTINLGRRSSESFVRIYDKAAEQKAKGVALPEGVESWTRVELEVKGDKADAVGRMLANTAIGSTKSAGQEAANLLYGLLDFKEANREDENKSRWKTVDWWRLFVGATEKRKLSLPKKLRSIERTKVWVRNQVSASLAMIVLSRDDDNGLSGWEFIARCVVEGGEKINGLQQLALDLYNEQQKAKHSPVLTRIK